MWDLRVERAAAPAAAVDAAWNFAGFDSAHG